jgi:hypothetical protein
MSPALNLLLLLLLLLLDIVPLQLQHGVWPASLHHHLHQIVSVARLVVSLQPDGTSMPLVSEPSILCRQIVTGRLSLCVPCPLPLTSDGRCCSGLTWK